MNKNARICVAGHRGLVGSAIVRQLETDGYTNLICRTRAELDLADAQATEVFFAAEQPEYVFLAAAKSGKFEPPLVNVGMGEDVTIRELAELVSEVVGYQGEIVFDTSKPDGTPRKLMDVSIMAANGWKARTALSLGLRAAYSDFRGHI